MSGGHLARRRRLAKVDGHLRHPRGDGAIAHSTCGAADLNHHPAPVVESIRMPFNSMFENHQAGHGLPIGKPDKGPRIPAKPVARLGHPDIGGQDEQGGIGPGGHQV
jgi:hypothetical protein